MADLLVCERLWKGYGGRQVLTDLNLNVQGGRIVGLLGPNGSGKTTLMKLVNGLLVPDSGKILVDGFAPGVESKKRVSYLPDADYLPDWMTVDRLLSLAAGEQLPEQVACRMLSAVGLCAREYLKRELLLLEFVTNYI